MTRKKPLIAPEVSPVEPVISPLSNVPSEAPLRRTKPSLESLLAETPENNRDEAWEKMPLGGKEC
jgi:hypothetical protein